MKKLLTTLLAIPAIVFSCSNDDIGPQYDGEAVLRIGTTFSADIRQVNTRATSTDPADFTVIIADAGTGIEVLREPMPAAGTAEYILPSGTYKVTVTSHPDGIPAPAFDTQVYGDTQNITLSKGDNGSLTMSCRQINAGVYFVYADDAADMEIIPTVVHADGTLTYPATDSEAVGYYAPGEVTVSFTADGTPIKVNGKEEQALILKAADLWEITMKLKSNDEGGFDIDADVIEVTDPTETPEWELGEGEPQDGLFTVAATPGTLQTKIETAGRQDVEELKITGSLDSSDYDYLKSANMPNLAVLDLSELTDTEIPAEALRAKTTLTSVALPSGLVTIGASAFRGCTGLAGGLVLPETVETIGNYAFYGCTGFTGSLVLSPALQTIGDYAFQNSTFTGNLILPVGLTAIGTSTFSGCKFDGNLTLGDNVKTIANNAFRYCDFTGDLVIPDEVVSIGNYAFQEVPFGGTLTLGSALEKIGSYAFQNASFSGSLVLPGSLITMDTYAFQNCGFGGVLTLGALADIPNYAFDGCTFTGALDLTNVTRVGTASFRNCIFSGDFKLSPAITSLGTNAFYGCSGLTGSIVIPENIKTIPSGLFQNCSGFNGTLTLSSATTSIASDAFNGCSSLVGEVEIPATVTSSGLNMRVFAGCTTVESFNVYWDEASKIPTYRTNMFPAEAHIFIPAGMAAEYEAKWASRTADEADATWNIVER